MKGIHPLLECNYSFELPSRIKVMVSMQNDFIIWQIVLIFCSQWMSQ